MSSVSYYCKWNIQSMISCSDEAKRSQFWKSIEHQIVNQNMNCVWCEHSITPSMADLFRIVALFSPMCDLYSTTTYTLLWSILQKTRNTRLYSLYYQVYIRGNPLSNQRIPLYCCVTSSTPKADLVNCSRDEMNISSVIHVFIETVNKTWSTTHLTDIIVRKPKLFSFNNISASQQTWPAVLLVKDCDWYNFELWCLIWSVDNKFCLVSMKHPYFS